MTDLAAPVVRWDPDQYARYAEERRRPFEDLLARIDATEPRLVVDLGCGAGAGTVSLARRWPAAHVIGVDNSPEMIAAARRHAPARGVEFVTADIAAYHPPAPVDVMVANAVLQWVPDHLGLLPVIADWLAPGGWLGVQVPDNFDEPSHRILASLRQSPRWRRRLAVGADRSAAVPPAPAYLDALLCAGLAADVWQSTYYHLLAGDDAVLEWLKGTALRPVLSALADDPVASRGFLDELAPLLREAYPAGEHATVLPFRRTFAVGRRDRSC